MDKEPRFVLLTEDEGDSLTFQELGPSRLAQAFFEAVRWLDSTARSNLPKEVRSDRSLVRLLYIRTSFFYGLSFHLDGKLHYVVPIVYPAFFEEFWRVGDWRFVSPSELAARLASAPSFMGIRGPQD